ncbi:hypothetical protein GCM10009834_49420 [Streptomonospora arabica]
MASETPGRPFRAHETAPLDTPAALAMSTIVGRLIVWFPPPVSAPPHVGNLPARTECGRAERRPFAVRRTRGRKGRMRDTAAANGQDSRHIVDGLG